MKSERRHELEENELAKSLGESVGFLKKHLNQILAGLIVLVLVIWIISYTVRGRSSAAQAEWTQYQQLLAPQSQEALVAAPGNLMALADETKHESLGAWASLAAGDIAYQAYIQMPLQGQDIRDSMKSQAAQGYQKVVSEYPEQVEQVALAHIGLGMLAEAEADMTRAQQHYEQAIALGARGASGVVARATDRLEALQSRPEPSLAEGLSPEMQAFMDAQAAARALSTQPASVPAESQPASQPTTLPGE